jgi:hypothetical protein
MSAAGSSEDLWIATDNGRLFAKRWRGTFGQPDRNVPIVLFHDSIGCIELWRDFPQQLARAAGRDVIAYDRLTT